MTADDLRKANADLPATWFEVLRGADVVQGRLQLLSPDHAQALALDPATLKATPVAPRRVAPPLPLPSLGHYRAAGVFTAGSGWLGLYSAADLALGARPGRSLRPVESARDTAEPLKLDNPPSVLMLHTLGRAPAGGTLAVSRVDMNGKLLWTTDTALHRFKLQQVLPGEGSTVFVGTRIPVPNRLSEPLLVILDHATGRIRSHSLWQ